MLVFPNSFSLPKSRCWSQSNTSTSEIPYIVNTPFSLAKSLRLAFRANHLLQRTYLEGCEKIGAANPQTKRWAATNLCWTLVRGSLICQWILTCTFTRGECGGRKLTWQKNSLSVLTTTCCLFWWKWKYIFLESFESVNSRRKSPSCGKTKKSSNISLEAKNNKNHNNQKAFLVASCDPSRKIPTSLLLKNNRVDSYIKVLTTSEFQIWIEERQLNENLWILDKTKQIWRSNFFHQQSNKTRNFFSTKN